MNDYRRNNLDHDYGAPDRKPARPDLSANDLLMGGAAVPEDDSGPGPWFTARYDSECATCDAAIFEGDTIRADGDGGYEGQDCCGD